MAGFETSTEVGGLVVLMSPVRAVADPIAPSNSSEFGGAVGIFGEASIAQGPDAVTGAMRYSYPFALPPARGGVQPRLALAYSSNSGDGEAGYGWKLSLPVIERRPMSGPPRFDDTSPSDYRFYFDGQPLVFVCDTGAGGCPNIETHPTAQAGWTELGPWRYFRLQVDDLHARFYLSSNKRVWRVQLVGGQLLEFGDVDGRVGTESGGADIVRWRLARQTDALHPLNFASFRWQAQGTSPLLYLSDIFYSPSTDANAGDDGFEHHVQFHWTSVPQVGLTTYAFADRARPAFVLAGVGVASKTWSNAGAREIVRRYHLTYATPRGYASFDPAQDAPLWGHAFLRQVQLEGDCQNSESGGTIPDSVQCTEFPPTSFDYEGGGVGFVSATPSRFEDAPATVAADRRFFSGPESTAIVDFNRDGLPDVVQSWERFGQPCPGGIHTTIDGNGTLVCHFSNPYTDPIAFRSARPMVGYANEGTDPSNSLRQLLASRCMDAGFDWGGAGGVSPEALTPTDGTAQFLNDQGASLTGAWSLGALLWGHDAYRPFLASPVSSGAGSGCDLENFDPNAFHPAWQWRRASEAESGSAQDWQRPADFSSDDMSGHAIWYADVDGDGLEDAFGTSETNPQGDFQPAYVRYTRRYGKKEPLVAGGAETGPAQVPFVDPLDSALTSVAPAEAPSGLTSFFYADVNGDGLVDLVTQNDTIDGGIPRVRPGDGRGRFACDVSKQSPSWPCFASPSDITPYTTVEIVDAEKPWPFANFQNIYSGFHDLTGDGLADIVKYDPNTGDVRLWVNQDGHTFACAGSHAGKSPCWVGNIVDDSTNATNFPFWRLTFADMNADGVDDLVVTARQGVFVARMTAFLENAGGSFYGSGTRPGQLIRVHNGTGATTQVQYATVQSLDRQAATSSLDTPWTHHSRAAASVVTEVLTTDDSWAQTLTPLGDPYAVERRVRYTYRDPAYDRWSRTLLGFRKVQVQRGYESAVTETTRWFGPCQNDRFDSAFNSSDPSTPDDPLARCVQGSDDEDAKAYVGRVVRVDRLIPGTPGQQQEQLLWTKIYEVHPQSASIFPGTGQPRSVVNVVVDARRVFEVPVDDVRTFFYDETAAVSARALVDTVPGGDRIAPSGTQAGAEHETHRKVERDTRGIVFRVTDYGQVDPSTDDPYVYADWTPETQLVTIYSDTEPADASSVNAPNCTADWLCRPRWITAFGSGGAAPSLKVREFQYDFADANGDVTLVQGYLQSQRWGSTWLGLDRGNADGADYRWDAPGQVVTDSVMVPLAHFSYDAFGNVTETRRGEESSDGSPPICTTLIYDAAFAHYPQVVKRHVAGCSSASLDTYTTFDRGFGKIATTEDPDGQIVMSSYDFFGRPQRITASEPDNDSFMAGVASFAYEDAAPLSRVQVIRAPNITSHTILNGLREPVITLTQGDGAAWTASGWRTKSASGAIYRAARVFGWTGDPVAAQANATPIDPLGGASSDGVVDSFERDGFGRTSSTWESTSSGATREVESRTYSPFAVTIRDAEQQTGAAHAGAFTTYETDGHGRPRVMTEHANGHDVQTAVSYFASGDPQGVEKWDASAGDYTRWFDYDTLGRQILAGDHDAGANTHNWQFVYDYAGRLVGWNDPRQCGANIYYDGVGRITAQDYSPCNGTQAAYTWPDLATGDGLEVRYQYDNYEAGQMSSDGSFTENGRYAQGQLTAAFDRGSHTRFSYDVRGRRRRTSRQLAKPADFASSPDGPYTTHWFNSRSEFDIGDRLLNRTTGVDVPELLVGGASDESYSYTPAGRIASIGSSYGALIGSMSYEPDGAVSSIIYGDAASTRADFAYDDRRRLTEYHVHRSSLGIWTAPPTADYSQPDDFTTQLELADYHYSYDDVGNPTAIDDLADPNPWPDHARPVSHEAVTYDDSYRVTSMNWTYAATSTWRPPFWHEQIVGDRHPAPQAEPFGGHRIGEQTFAYDYLGNVVSSDDDEAMRYDRSLGATQYGDDNSGPSHLQAADGIRAYYDLGGNLVQLQVERAQNCWDGTASRCAQVYAYDWDEVGQLARARRWDFVGQTIPQPTPDPEVAPPLPTDAPAWDVTYAYSMGARVLKSAKDAAGVARHTAEVFGTLRLQHTTYDEGSGEYDYGRSREHAYVGGVAHVFWDGGGSLDHSVPHADSTQGYVTYLALGDHLGSSAITIDHASGELVERTTYTPQGTTEADYRPDRWNNFREDYKFTGKEEDIEVGATYFGARYYQPYLGRFMSPDPLSQLTVAGDVNPYAYVGGKLMRLVDPWGLDGEESGAAPDDGVVQMPEDFITVSVPKPTADPAPEPTQEPAPEPTPDPAPEPTPDPAPPAPPPPFPIPEPMDLAAAAQTAAGWWQISTGTALGTADMLPVIGVPGTGLPTWGDLAHAAMRHAGITMTPLSANAETGTKAALTVASAVVGGGGAIMAEKAAAGAAQAAGGLEAAGAAKYAASTPQSAIALSKQLASEAQLGEMAAGTGERIAGVGARVPFRDAGRIARTYGGSAADWVKMSSSGFRAADGTTFQTHWVENIVTGAQVEAKVTIDVFGGL